MTQALEKLAKLVDDLEIQESLAWKDARNLWWADQENSTAYAEARAREVMWETWRIALSQRLRGLEAEEAKGQTEAVRQMEEDNFYINLENRLMGYARH